LDRVTLEVEVTTCSRSVVVVRVSGEADADHVDSLKEQLASAVRRNPSFVILDLAGLRFISREAVASLEAFRQQRCRRGGEVWLAGLQPSVWLAIQDAGLGGKFPIRESLDQVFAS
jgi:anti-anti-sigma factor